MHWISNKEDVCMKITHLCIYIPPVLGAYLIHHHSPKTPTFSIPTPEQASQGEGTVVRLSRSAHFLLPTVIDQQAERLKTARQAAAHGLLSSYTVPLLADIWILEVKRNHGVIRVTSLLVVHGMLTQLHPLAQLNLCIPRPTVTVKARNRRKRSWRKIHNLKKDHGNVVDLELNLVLVAKLTNLIPHTPGELSHSLSTAWRTITMSCLWKVCSIRCILYT